MEIVKYLCEFFFDNFWHWLELIILMGIISQKVIVNKNKL